MKRHWGFKGNIKEGDERTETQNRKAGTQGERTLMAKPIKPIEGEIASKGL